MRFRLGNRCWQCNEPLAINAEYCPRCGAWPRPKTGPDRGGTQVGGLLGWLVDNAIWIVAVLALAVAVPLTIRAYADDDDLAPEPAERTWPRACYAEESLAQLEAVLPPGTLLYGDVPDADRPGTGPASAYLRHADRGAQRAFLISELIVADGVAVGDRPIADVEIGARIQVAENEARAEQAGPWGACPAPAAIPTA